MLLRTRNGLILGAALILVGLSPTPLFADTIVIGTVDSVGNVTPNAFDLSNTGTEETRGVIEFALSLFGQGSDAEVLSATLTMTAVFDSAKTLEVFTYAANGASLDAADFNPSVGSPIFSQFFNPTTSAVDIVIDATDDLNALLTSDATAIGFNFRESVSSGSLVAIEYLFVGTIVGQGTVTITSSVNPTTGLFGPATVTTPEPALLGLLALAGGTAMVRRRRSGPAGSKAPYRAL